jgi:Domain of unknown function (DUF4145)
MPLLVANCPRCGAKSITFDVLAQTLRTTQYGWQHWYEAFSVCRKCHRSAIFLVAMKSEAYHQRSGESVTGEQLMQYKGSLNDLFSVERYISIRDEAHHPPPEFLSDELANAFTEGATCFSVACYNASATMFRLCVDLVTRPLLPDPANAAVAQPNSKQRRDLGLRLPWLFDNKLLDVSLKELAKCIREDGNDGAHAGNLSKEDTEDILDFTTTLLERLVTEPKRLEQAEARRNARRQPKTPP